MAYASRRLTPAEENYTITERETLAVVYALQVWRLYLFKHFQVFTDNQAVTYLHSKRHLSRREARWVEFFADFHFSTHHIPGKLNSADGLTRQDVSPKLASPPEVHLNSIEYVLEVNEDVSKTIKDAYPFDSELSPIINRLKGSDQDNLHERYYWDKDAHRLYLRAALNNRLCVPKCKVRLQLLQEYHDCAMAGHSGRDRTYFRLARFFYWPKMGTDVKKFVKSCNVCQRSKGNQLRSGLLQPCQYQPHLGMISPWTLSWVCL